MPRSCRSSDMVGASMPYPRAGAGRRAGDRRSREPPGTQEHQQGGPGTRPVARRWSGATRTGHPRPMGKAAWRGYGLPGQRLPLHAREREAMTSRQPGTVPSGSTAGVGVPGGGDHAGGDRAEAALTAQDWLLRLLPLTLLIIAGLAGLRGAVGDLQWNGPLHRDALAVGVVL